ncbi:glycosyltransferase [Rhodobacterales bacterium LSUCC0246]|nr:glycosyltransferase [Rhodobacterales bacterium LSUCC0374]
MPITVIHLSSVHERCDVRIFVKECAALLSAGYSVSLMVADGMGAEVSNGIRIYDVGKPKSRLDRVFISSFKLFLKSLNSDASVIHLHDPELLPFGLLLKLFGKKVIFDAHEDVVLQLLNKPYLGQIQRRVLSILYKFVEFFICKHLSGIVAATPAIATKFEKLNPNVVTVCNYPSLTEFLAIRSSERVSNIVCYVGGISQVRGMSGVLDALGLTQSNAVLYLAGACLEPDFKIEIENNKAWHKVTYFGTVDRAGVVSIYERASLGLVTLLPIPNYLEALPVKMFEYMAAGLPVIASNFPLWKRLISDTKCGICVDPEKPQEIADAVDYLLSNPVEAQAMGKNGRKAVVDLYNWDNERPKLIAMYDSLTAESNRPPLLGM